MLRAFARGLGTTLKMFTRPKVTVRYPEQKTKRAFRFRGRHELRRYANGLEMCVGCELCQVACPANAITVVGAENDPARPTSAGERYAYEYRIDMLRCIFCGLCEEACPTGALRLTGEFELAAHSREALVYQRDRLVAAEPGEESVPELVYPAFRGHGYGGPEAYREPDRPPVLEYGPRPFHALPDEPAARTRPQAAPPQPAPRRASG